MNNNTLDEEHSSLVRSPLFWTSVAQCAITLFIFIVVVHTWLTTRTTIKDRMKNISWKIQLVEQRLRLQEPNVHLIEQMAKDINVTYNDVGDDSQRILNHIWNEEIKKSKEKQ